MKRIRKIKNHKKTNHFEINWCMIRIKKWIIDLSTSNIKLIEKVLACLPQI